MRLIEVEYGAGMHEPAKSLLFVAFLGLLGGIAMRAQGTDQAPEPVSRNQKKSALGCLRLARSFSSRGAPAATTRPATSRSRPANA
jgi:hypothetical protein